MHIPKSTFIHAYKSTFLQIQSCRRLLAPYHHSPNVEFLELHLLRNHGPLDPISQAQQQSPAYVSSSRLCSLLICKALVTPPSGSSSQGFFPACLPCWASRGFHSIKGSLSVRRQGWQQRVQNGGPHSHSEKPQTEKFRKRFFSSQGPFGSHTESQDTVWV